MQGLRKSPDTQGPLGDADHHSDDHRKNPELAGFSDERWKPYRPGDL